MDEASTNNRNILFHIMVEVKKIKSKGAGGTAKFEKKEIKVGEGIKGEPGKPGVNVPITKGNIEVEKRTEKEIKKPEETTIQEKAGEAGILPEQPKESFEEQQQRLNQELADQGIKTELAIHQNDFLQRSQGKKPLEEMALYQQVLLTIAATGGAKLPGQFSITPTQEAIFAGNAQQTAVQKANQVGTEFKPVVGNAAKVYATNGKSLVKSAALLLKSGFNLKTAPIILGAIGSYPFAGFIKEEALQTISFGIKGAKDSGDLAGEEAAIQQMDEVLEPNAWSKILGLIPYVNVLKSLKDFYEAARTKLEIDKTNFEKRKSL